MIMTHDTTDFQDEGWEVWMLFKKPPVKSISLGEAPLLAGPQQPLHRI